MPSPGRLFKEAPHSGLVGTGGGRSCQAGGDRCARYHLERERERERERETPRPGRPYPPLTQVERNRYTVGRGNVKPQEKKVDAIATWPQPQTKRQVRTFLGLMGYYRQFIPNFASIATPLHELTSKSAPNRVKWTDQTERAFNHLKKALLQRDCVACP